MYAKLIFKNAKRSVKDYLIYIVTMTLCVTLFYAFLSISSTHYHPTIGAEYNISLLAGGMKLAICGITVECAGLSTVLLEFCVVVACQLHPLGDSRITVAEHPHIELHVTVKDVLNPSILYIELQTDVGNLVILR